MFIGCRARSGISTLKPWDQSVRLCNTNRLFFSCACIRQWKILPWSSRLFHVIRSHVLRLFVRSWKPFQREVKIYKWCRLHILTIELYRFLTCKVLVLFLCLVFFMESTLTPKHRMLTVISLKTTLGNVSDLDWCMHHLLDVELILQEPSFVWVKVYVE